MRLRSSLLWLAVLYMLWPHMLCAQSLLHGISLPPSLNFATSPNPMGAGARAQGRGLAFIGIADDATAASHNPGGLVQLERPEVSIVGLYSLRVEQQDVTRPDTVVENQTLDYVNLNYLSAVYPFRLWQRNVVVSLNFRRLFDLEGNTDVASRFVNIDGIQRVHSRQTGGLFTISPAVAVQLTPTFSVGVAFNIWPDLFGNGWDQQVDVRGEGRVVIDNRIVPFVSTGRIQEHYAFQGFNVTAGFLWELSSMLRLGGVIRTPFTAHVTHTNMSSLTVTFQDGSAPVSTRDHFQETLAMHLPLSYGLGLAALLSDSLTLALDVVHVHWSDLRLQASTHRGTLLVEQGAPSGKGRSVLQGQGDDTTSVRLGAEYLWIRPKMVIPFRAGVFYDPEPSEGGPDHFFGFSLGSGIAINRVLVDLAYTLRTGTVTSTATDTSVHQHTLLASVIYHF